ncbi:hypothetical protein SLEP1_g15388 [Rubroshorea leprosula]|uniref:Uncharacterized protein n=1 Tax=Rubroshorea leprosula TaxID=152421 RepID=A0AAV5IYW8_9ROSI|nr:hypothetical protein SLEP1_g15388 [Rubroshorea leprosula]
MLSTYCVMMMLCTTALCADVCLCSTSINFRAHHWSGILRTIIVLTGLLTVISLLSISKPHIASVSLFMWLLLAIHLILSLYRDLTQPILPITINTTSNSISVVFNSVNAVFGVVKNWATNLFHSYPTMRRYFVEGISH